MYLFIYILSSTAILLHILLTLEKRVFGSLRSYVNNLAKDLPEGIGEFFLRIQFDALQSVCAHWYC